MGDPAGPVAFQEENDFAPASKHHNGSSIPPTSLAVSANHVKHAQNPKVKEETYMEAFCSWLVEHQIGLAANLLTLLFLTHLCFPRARTTTRKFFKLSYYSSETGLYIAGWDDACLVLFWIVAFTGIRCSVMDYVMMPFARRYGIKTISGQVRFAEQGWLFIYDSIFWTLGMYIMYHSDYWWNIDAVWEDWPNREIDGLRKWYILAQYAFWLQQIIVVNIEKRRKDYWQMFLHHIVTTSLIFSSYCYNQTKVANLILCTMDIVDIILPFAKCLKYLGFTTICDYLFGLFMVTWFFTRHVYYPFICWSLYFHTPTVMNLGCYRGGHGQIEGPFPPPDKYWHLLEPFYDQTGVVCWDLNINNLFLGALLFLQGIALLWFYMVIKVALKVLKGNTADDLRSDDEADEEVAHENEKKQLQPYEEEVGVEEINLKGRHGNGKTRYRKPGSHSSGVSHSSDRKELLGRIGCDKPI